MAGGQCHWAPFLYLHVQSVAATWLCQGAKFKLFCTSLMLTCIGLLADSLCSWRWQTKM